MNRKTKTLRRLKWLREQQQKTAAHRRSAAEKSLLSAEDGVSEARTRYARASEALTTQVTEVERVSDLELLRGELDDRRAEIRSSQHLAAEARMHLDARAAEVRARQLALRTTEKLLERAVAEETADLERKQQLESDDRAAAGRKRSA